MNKNVRHISVVCAFALICGLLTYFQVFETPELWCADKLYQHERKINNNIKIIAVDEKTINKYGTFGSWSRQTAADVINNLNSNGNSPAVIGFDITYTGNLDADGDEAFAAAAENAGNVVLASGIDFKESVRRGDDDKLYIDKMYADNIELPFEQVRKVTQQGFANTIQDNDNYIRKSLMSVQYEGNTEYSFSYMIYKKYLESIGGEEQQPKTDSDNGFGFKYAAKPTAYETYSFADVAEGVYDSKIFNGAIVLVGAYATGMQDQYFTPIKRNDIMYGVEIHANIIDALLTGDTYLNINILLQSVINTILALILGVAVYKCKLKYLLPATLVLLAAYIGAAWYLFNRGMMMYVFTLPACIAAADVVKIGYEYVIVSINRRRVITAFKKYMAPQVVDELSGRGEFNIELGGETRDIAVLFVDIRGFTPLSESLQPIEVVNILNEYFSIVTEAIFKYGGTLDKFIGDAAMAVFNAPIDLDDYEYRAVCTAMDMLGKSDALRNEFHEKYGKDVSFGIGIHCGKAVVGNIGSETRMDYTAIGDTVNTASRLEGSAGRGQVVISKELYDRIGNRLQVQEIGEISLKGKEKKILAYQVDKVL